MSILFFVYFRNIWRRMTRTTMSQNLKNRAITFLLINLLQSHAQKQKATFLKMKKKHFRWFQKLHNFSILVYCGSTKIPLDILVMFFSGMFQ